jgi:hypothetical protein
MGPATPAPKKVETTLNPSLDPTKLAAAKVAPPAPVEKPVASAPKPPEKKPAGAEAAA